MADSDGQGDEHQTGLRLETFLPYRLVVAAHVTSEALSRIYRERHKLGLPEWRILVILGQFGSMTGKAIGQHSYMHKTKVSRAVRNLERRMWVVRNKSTKDLREAPLSLTAAGRAIYEELAPRALHFETKILSAVDPADREAFSRAIRKLTERSTQLDGELAVASRTAARATRQPRT